MKKAIPSIEAPLRVWANRKIINQKAIQSFQKLTISHLATFQAPFPTF
jgi:hypothetical protein